MKKKIAVILCFVLAAFSLIGCSQAELAYLDMSKQLSSESYKATGVLTGEIDFDALAALAQKTTNKFAEDGFFYTSETPVSDEFSAMGLEGKKEIKIHYDMLANMKDSMAFQADFDVEFNGKAYNMGDLYFDASKGLYLSKELVIGIFDFYKDMAPSKWDSYFYSKEYRDELLKSLGDSDYIYAGFFDGMSEDEKAQVDAMMSSMMNSMNQDIYDEAYKFLTTAFSGFTTGAVSKVSGGYKISLDGKQTKTLIIDLLQYLIDNTDRVISAYKDYMFAIFDYVDLPEEEVTEAKAAFDELVGPQNQMMVSATLAAAKQMFVEADKAGYIDFLDGFKYEATVKKQGDTFKQQEEMYLKDSAKTVFSIASESEVVIQSVEIDLPQSAVSFEDIEKELKALDNKHNPVTSTTILWRDYDLEDVFIQYERESDSPFSNKFDMQVEDYLLKESRLYVPLRSISENLGENVAWDQNTMKAYVVRGDQQIDMTGILMGGKTYIKVRDFEKLGYKVAYEFDENWGEHSARISR